MTFNVNLEMTDHIAQITLVGELDANATPAFREKINEAAAKNVKCLVLHMDQLTYMASAGLRVLIFAKQRMGRHAQLYLIGTQDTVKETLELTGFHYSLTMLDEYDIDHLDCA
ncbi:MAG: anti-sigma factor antagonist [Ardenticatenaceae bacterium]